jgi:predicted amidohydrolase
MTESFPLVKVAVVQAAPILFDRETTVEKVRQLTVEAAAQGAQLIFFPLGHHYPGPG